MLKAKTTKKFTKHVLQRQFKLFLKSLPDEADAAEAGAAETDESDEAEESESDASSDKEFQSLQESDITTKLSASILSLELNNRFQELFDLRNSVILLSHCIGQILVTNIIVGFY